MSQASQTIESAALLLPPEERARLAERLLASLDVDPEVEAAWAAEIAERIDGWDNGLIDEISWAEAHKQILARLQSK